MAGELLNLDIKDFTQVSSVALGDYVLLVRANGMNGKIGIELFKASVVSDIKPSIRDGYWWIGEVAQNVKAIGQTPVFRKGELGLEWKYQDEDDSGWKLLVEYTDIIFTFDDLSPEQKDELALHFEDLTPENIAELQRPATEATSNANSAADKANQAASNATNAASAANSAAQAANTAKDAANAATQKTNEAISNANSAADAANQATLDVSAAKQSALDAAAKANTAAQNADSSRAAIEQNEAERQSNETERQNAEAIRVQNENSRKIAENLRVQAEQLRVTAEENRVSAFDEKIEEINTTNSNFTKAEEIRQQQEAIRQEQTSLAISNANSAAQAANTAKTSADEATVNANNAAGNANSAAQAANTAKENIEANEATRIQSENDRIAQENARQESESQRESEFSTLKNNIDLAIEGAEEATVNTNAAINAATEATQNAYEAAFNANQLPKIQNDTWWIWDIETSAYIDSGSTAIGKSPKIIENTWWVWDNELGDYVNTNVSVNSTYELTKAKIEAVFTGNITTHTHSQYLTEEKDPTVPSWAKAASKPTYTASEVGAVAIGDKGKANGVATLDSTGKVPSSQLPSYVDDVIEATSLSSFPSTGEPGKIYVDTSTNKTYRWGGTGYVEISSSLALGTTSSTAFRGDYGNTAYQHSLKTSGNPHGVTKADVGLSNVGNFKAVSTAANQGLTDAEKANARSNIGAGASSFSGDYNDLTNKPSIGNATVTVKQNGTTKGSFTLNQSSNVEIALTDNNTTYSVVGSSGSTGLVKNGSSVTDASGYTACPIVGGVPYYKDTNTTYTLSSFGITATAAELNYCDGVTSNIQTQLNEKAASSHTHDDRYYTESEMNTKLNGKANTNQTMYIGTTAVPINRASAALTLNGVNVSGSSGSCTGNAASASSVAWTGVSGRPTKLSQFTNDSGFITTTTANNTYATKAEIGDINSVLDNINGVVI